jgi:hypothetical protein
MPLGTDTMMRIAVELQTGKAPPRPDTPEEAEARRTLTREIREIEEKGGIVDLPPEIAG